MREGERVEGGGNVRERRGEDVREGWKGRERGRERRERRGTNEKR